MTPYIIHRYWMEKALNQAKLAGEIGEVPVGAIIVDHQGNLLAETGNRKETNQDPTAHAEMLAIRQASQRLQTWHLNNCTLYVTLEPCPMCTGALIQSRLGLLVYGCDEPKSGTIRTVMNLPDSACSNHRLAVISGILEEECRQQLQQWFRERRH
ncbi:CMP/dCMP deaminase zinc-binding [Rippkaea orientalis PCC 8801]|uniref:tRNA-specific adenosine deaminase n=1 Tax=Rippkaea orientalis (strain PCC 8801 / RF-1) TaxID=41431 RepID=B7K5H2_RIPO1|nr:tRNA adenosine(34) deaminase TadA [Rippkaea orientalis]ACK66705.1 CMP/dCMP deaminase zinc-binding [Rippkaea orientalis PCC 8801]